MGFQGSLSSVNLGDIFQTLAMNRQTGTLSVRTPEMSHHIWFVNGEIAMCDQPMIDGYPGLLIILMHRGLLSKQQVDDLAQRASAGSQPLRELILASGDVPEQDFEVICSTQVEEVVCEIFEWPQGDFVFTDGDPIPDLANPHVIELGEIHMQSAGVVMEATRRSDEWNRIREVITNDEELYVVDNEGRANINKIEADQEVLKVLRYLDGRHKLNEIALAISVSRFDVFAIVSQLVINGIARTRSEQEIVNDALTIRDEGNLDKARELLENAVERSRLPEIIRPLAEICIELQDIPRAVELYLELIQNEQDDGDIETALSDLDKVIAVSPDDPELQIDRAEMLFELGQTDEAAETYLTAANAYLNSRNIEEALTACHRAKDLNHLSPTPHRYLAKAYILDRQTESALVEYKSLWHTLLSSSRPRKAMDKLQSILEEDCKIASLKENVLNYAKGSDAVKTGSAIRMLVYLIILGLLGAGGWYGWDWYQKNHVVKGAVDNLADLEKRFNTLSKDNQYKKIISEAVAINVSDQEFNNKQADFITKVKNAYESRATELVSSIEVDLSNRKFTEADKKLKSLHIDFGNTDVHNRQYQKLKNQYDIAFTRSEIQEDLGLINQLWDEQDWDASLEKLTELTARITQPASIHDELKAMLNEREALNKKSASLYQRAQVIEKDKSLRQALKAYKRAAQGEGETFRSKAETKISEIEEQLATIIKEDIAKAVELADNAKVYDLIKELDRLAETARSSRPRQIRNTLRLPMTIEVDSHHTSVTVRESGREYRYQAPDKHQGPWKETFEYPVQEQITITASRTGFSDYRKQHKVSENNLDALTQLRITLKRGPLWSAQLNDNPNTKPVTTPVLAGNLILVGTNDNDLILIDALGKANPIDLNAQVAVFSGDPVVFKRVAYAVIGDRIFAVDLNTRNVIWTYPDERQADFAGRFVDSVMVQEHELKAEGLQLFVGTAEGQLVALEIDGSNQVSTYPKNTLGWAASAAPFSYSHDNIRGVVYMPAGQRVIAYDISSVTSQDPMEKIYEFKTVGDILTRPVPARVTGSKALLITDSTGTLNAISANPDNQRGVRAPIASWGLEGGARFAPAVDHENNIAVVTFSNGAVTAVDLNKAGQPLWRFPDQGRNLGSINGPAAIGKNGVYVADSTGNLLCLDLKTGKQKWQVDLLSAANTGVLAHDGRVYVGTRAGSVLCFEEGQD